MKLAGKSLLDDVSTLVRHRASDSTSHCFSKVARSKGFTCTFIWFIVAIVAASCCSFMIFDFLTEYLTYPVTTKIRYIPQKSADLPTVGICNSNPYVTEYAVNFLIDSIER